MNKKYEMYHGKIDKVFHNNKNIYISDSKNNIPKTNDIRKKINDIINDNSFIYRTKVNIVIGNNIISKKIIGIVGNDLLTIDNEKIPISSIKNIYK